MPYVFHRDGEEIRSFRKAWDGACERAGLVGAWFHDLRRTAVVNLERAGVPRSVATNDLRQLPVALLVPLRASRPKAPTDRIRCQ